MNGKCRLCLKKTDLKYSHIIPEYFYKPMYDDKHRFMQITTVPEEPTTFIQKGIREYLLCEKCEQQFSVYERYASQSYYHIESDNTTQNGNIFVAEKVDYALMKLFQLSILWRASVSKLEVFGDVKLDRH